MNMKLLLTHNYYQQPGGEDQVFADEGELLEREGHSVIRYVDHNVRLRAGGVRAAGDTVWSRKSFARLRAVVEPNLDLAHFHNTFPLISPSAYYAVREMGLPVVQTLHNYRLLCPAATFLRDGVVCEKCLVSGTLLPAVRYRCYRGSLPATTTVAAMLAIHRVTGTWQRKVDIYIALSEFARRKFIEGGLPAERIAVKPNFIGTDPGMANGEGGYALFVGRLAEEKGIRTLVNAWQHLSDIPLIVVGDGPLNSIQWPIGITVLGSRSREKVFSLMRDARILIFPSIWYECAPMTIIEAFACGLPVIASNLGSISEFVAHRKTGLLFQPGDAEDLARQVRWSWDHPEDLRDMRAAARREYEHKYTAERNYKMLMSIYQHAMESARSRQ